MVEDPASNAVSFSGIEYVFLDRDGTINKKLPEGEYVDRWSKVSFLPGAETAISTLNHSGKTVIVVTNQRGVALGHYTEADLRRLHVQLQMHIASHSARIDAFYYCPHDRNQCECRKPNTGLFETAFRDYPCATPRNSVMIGDSLSDIQAARKLGMRSIFILGDPETQKPDTDEAAALADAVVDSLHEAVIRHLS